MVATMRLRGRETELLMSICRASVQPSLARSGPVRMPYVIQVPQASKSIVMPGSDTRSHDGRVYEH